MAEEVKHDFHLVDPSPWPAVAAASAFLTFFGLVLYMHPSTLGVGLEPMIKQFDLYILIPGVALLMFASFGWWKDVIAEANGGDHKPIVQLGMRYGMVLFILSEVMFFSAFFWAYFDAALFPA
ncbi:MAG: cytochrome c oxidase subunit 3, partial [Alphaproteobacteria bacterium]|nr:cytochrome c oxidase subunit 3 [Alphaproteobacteria bacterium]